MQTEFEDVISCLREDDKVLAEMLGITSEMDSCHPQGEAGDDIDDYGPDFVSPINQAPEYEHYDKTWLIGVIRGSKQTPLKFDGPWVNIKQLLDWVERKRAASHRPNGREATLPVQGPLQRPTVRVHMGRQAYYPLWVSGHHQSLAERLADSFIATEWLSHYKSQELTGKYTTFEGRPVVGIDKASWRTA